jgi:hypothetical protein
MAKTVELKFPFNVGQLEVKSVTINRPKTKDFIAIGTSSVQSAEADAKLLSSLSGLPENVVEQIDIEDWAVIRTHLSLIWTVYFTGIAYNENPTVAEPETPRETKRENA